MRDWTWAMYRITRKNRSRRVPLRARRINRKSSFPPGCWFTFTSCKSRFVSSTLYQYRDYVSLYFLIEFGFRYWDWRIFYSEKQLCSSLINFYDVWSKKFHFSRRIHSGKTFRKLQIPGITHVSSAYSFNTITVAQPEDLPFLDRPEKLRWKKVGISTIFCFCIKYYSSIQSWTAGTI